MCYPFGHDGAGGLGSHPSQGARLQRKGGAFRVIGRCDTPATNSCLTAPKACREHKTLRDKSCTGLQAARMNSLSKAGTASCDFLKSRSPKGHKLGNFTTLQARMKKSSARKRVSFGFVLG